MARLEKDIEDFLNLISKDIINRTNQKNQNVSGKVAKSLKVYSKTDKNEILTRLVGFKWIVAAWETGRGKRKSKKKTDFEQKLQKWIDRKGLDIKASSLRYLINKKGTLLHQGKDRRFSGNISGILSDFITQKRLNELSERIGKSIVDIEITPLLNFKTK